MHKLFRNVEVVRVYGQLRVSVPLRNEMGAGRNGAGLSPALAMGLPEFTCIIPLLGWKGRRCVQEVETLPAKA